MKKILAIVLAMSLGAVALSGCGQKPTDSGTKDAGYILLEEDFGAEEYGIAFKKGSNDLALEVQKILEEMQADGTAAKIEESWFGSDILMKDAKYLDESIVSNAGDGSLDALKANGTFVLGLDASFPPMGFTNDKGEIVGFDIDLAKEVTSRMGINLKLQPINWDTKEMELESGNINAIWNGMTITDERKAAMTFAKPYVANKQVVIVAAGSDIKTLGDLKDKTVGLQRGSSALDAVEGNAAVSSTFKSLEQYEDNVMAFSDLENKRLDAVVMDVVVAKYIIAQNAK